MILFLSAQFMQTGYSRHGCTPVCHPHVCLHCGDTDAEHMSTAGPETRTRAGPHQSRKAELAGLSSWLAMWPAPSQRLCSFQKLDTDNRQLVYTKLNSASLFSSPSTYLHVFVTETDSRSPFWIVMYRLGLLFSFSLIKMGFLYVALDILGLAL